MSLTSILVEVALLICLACLLRQVGDQKETAHKNHVLIIGAAALAGGLVVRMIYVGMHPHSTNWSSALTFWALAAYIASTTRAIRNMGAIWDSATGGDQDTRGTEP